MQARFRLGRDYTSGEVVRVNHHTVWVRLTALRSKHRIVQRHRVKHDVTLLGSQEG